MSVHDSLWDLNDCFETNNQSHALIVYVFTIIVHEIRVTNLEQSHR